MKTCGNFETGSEIRELGPRYGADPGVGYAEVAADASNRLDVSVSYSLSCVAYLNER
jgi:hypothetical protein